MHLGITRHLADLADRIRASRLTQPFSRQGEGQSFARPPLAEDPRLLQRLRKASLIDGATAYGDSTLRWQVDPSKLAQSPAMHLWIRLGINGWFSATKTRLAVPVPVARKDAGVGHERKRVDTIQHSSPHHCIVQSVVMRRLPNLWRKRSKATELAFISP